MTTDRLYGPAMKVKTVDEADAELRFLAEYAIRRWDLSKEEAVKIMKENIVTYSRMHRPEAEERMITLFAVRLPD